MSLAIHVTELDHAEIAAAPAARCRSAAGSQSRTALPTRSKIITMHRIGAKFSGILEHDIT